MANNREPKVRLHKASGTWILAIDGKTHYLSKSLEEAEQKSQPLLDAWRAKTGRGQVYAGRESAASQSAQNPPNAPPLVSQAATRLQDWVRGEMGDNAADAVGLKLKGFLAKFGTRQIGMLKEDELEDWRSAIVAKYPNPTTANDRLGVLRRLLKFAFERRMVASPYRSEVLLQNVKKKRPPKKAQPPEKVLETIQAVAALNPNLARHMLLAFYCSLRPAEVSRLIAGAGEFATSNPKWRGKVFTLNHNKNAWRGQARNVCLTPEALKLLEEIREHGKQGSVRQAMPPNMHAQLQACQQLKAWNIKVNFHWLRHSSLTALVVNGADRDCTETAAGHTMPYVQGTYYPAPFGRTLEAMRVLPKLVPYSAIEFAERTVTRGKDRKQRVCPPRKVLQAA